MMRGFDIIDLLGMILLVATIAFLIDQVGDLKAERDRLIASHRCFTYECQAQMGECGKDKP